MSQTLVLNASYEPLGLVSWRRAIVLVLNGKASVLEQRDEHVHSESLSIAAPSVVRLRTFVRVPYRRSIALTRRALMTRDAYRCVYCGDRADTLDHVHPRSRGGRHTWSNVVAACGPCNRRKADRLLSELGWSLAVVPAAPSAAASLWISAAHRHPNWNRYIEAWDTPAHSA